ncbi:MAG: hypothetical protein LBU37_00385 [Tannerellaceae bacterium]|jgi:hypothetical protein|nr:hypothetical protein [Tannerellaceae bacterium]
MKKKILIITIGVLFCWLFGFITGRKTIRLEEKTEQVKGETITGNVPVLQPVKEEIPDNPVLPLKTTVEYRDTIIYKHLSVDTAAIIEDYINKRHYRELLFDNSLGRLELSMTAQYNRLTALDWSFTPIYTMKTVERKKVWIPFVSASYGTLNYFTVGGGVFYHDVGLNVRYISDFNKNGLDVGLMYRF